MQSSHLREPMKLWPCLLKLVFGAPAALEASYKERMQLLLNHSASVASKHVARRMSDIFQGYELEEGTWLHGCLHVRELRDSVENCILRQLQALTALCDSLQVESRAVAQRHLEYLLGNEMPELGMKLQKMSQGRWPLFQLFCMRLLACTAWKGVVERDVKWSKWCSGSIFLFRKMPDSSDMDASPAVQASMLMAVARCGQALGQKQHLDDAEASSELKDIFWSESKGSVIFLLYILYTVPYVMNILYIYYNISIYRL